MRILSVGNMYPPHHLGGYELMWRSAVGHLRAWGHDVRVLTTRYRTPSPDPGIPEDDDVHRRLGWYWRDHDLPPLGLRRVVAMERANAATLRRQIDSFRPDVLAWWAMGGMSLSLIEQARRARLPAAAVVVDEWLRYGPLVDRWTSAAGRAGPLRGPIERTLGVPARMDLERAATWLFASEALRRHAADAGWHPPLARVAHPGIDHELFRAPRDARSGWTWRLLYCGRIDERKGIDTAIEALASLPDEATLTVVGGGDQGQLAQLRALAERLGVAGRVSFERHDRDRLPDVYARADATLFPVRWAEPFGLVPLESMAMGTPVIATGRGGSGEYLRDGENCLIFEVEAGGPALAEAVSRLAGDPELRERVRDGGLATAAQFREETFDRAVETSLREARELLSRPPRRAGS